MQVEARSAGSEIHRYENLLPDEDVSASGLGSKLTHMYKRKSGPLSKVQYILSVFLLWGGTCSLRMPALRPASQAGPMRNPSEGTSVVLRDTITLT